MHVRYIARRLLHLVPTLFGAILLVFLGIRLAPGGPIQMLLGDWAASASPELVAQLEKMYGLDKSTAEQFGIFVWNILRGDFGLSMRYNQPVMSILGPNIGSTIALTSGALLLAVVVGVPTGIMSALRRNSIADYSSMTLSVLWVSAPGFWLAYVLIYVFGFRIPLFPMFGAGQSGNAISQVYHLVLPCLALGMRSAALLTRVSRSAMFEVLSQDYVRTARAKGLSGRVVVYKHALRNAAIPIVTVVGMDIAHLLGGSVVTETVFARPGLGKTIVDAILSRDYPVVQGGIMVFTFAVITTNLLTDLVYCLFDPRVQYD